MIGNLVPGLISLGVAPVTSSYESIASVTVGSGGSSTVTFSSIPATYTHLQIRGIFKGSSSNDALVLMQCNSDTGSNYARHTLRGNGSSASANAQTSQTATVAGFWHPTFPTPDTNNFGATVVDIVDYLNTNKYKTVRVLSGTDNNNTYGTIVFSSGLWMSSSAITSLTLIGPDSGTFAQYSSFALYGIKGS